MSVGAFPVRGLDGQLVELDRATVDRFAAGVDGPVLREGEAGFDDAIRIWNALASKTPALVVQPTGTHDVVRSVRFATDQGLLCPSRVVATTSRERRSPKAV